MEQKEKEKQLKTLFDAGDTTFKTLGVIDTNVSVEESQRGRKKKRGKGEKTEGKGDDGGKDVNKKRRAKENAGQHSSTQSQPPPAPRKERPLFRQQPTPAMVMDVELTSTVTVAGVSQASKATAAVRAIVFR